MGAPGNEALRMITSTALIELILLWYPSFQISKEATLRRRAGRQHGARSETFWASCIMLFVLPGKDGRVTGCTEPPPESQMDYSLTPPSAPFTGYSNAVCSQLCCCGLFLRAPPEQIKHTFFQAPRHCLILTLSFSSTACCFFPSSFFTFLLCLRFNDLFL